MSALFTADELAHATGGAMTRPFHATGVSIDTRTIEPGDLFVALHTNTGDGHAHVAEALRRGAAGALVHRQEGAPDDAPLLVVRDTLAALTSLGAHARERFEGAVVAVTGSVGKTTTKEMLRTMLAACGPTHAAHASYNNHWGVPLTLARMPADAAYAVIEIGMNNPGEVAPLAKLAAPDVAVITAVEAAHIGHLGSLDAIADEKAAIMQGAFARRHRSAAVGQPTLCTPRRPLADRHTHFAVRSRKHPGPERGRRRQRRAGADCGHRNKIPDQRAWPPHGVQCAGRIDRRGGPRRRSADMRRRAGVVLTGVGPRCAPPAARRRGPPCSMKATTRRAPRCARRSRC